eukprot:TRINITY_DN10458_c0_g1_i1.p1 TRINITY_DN10458_c0_g1~~TRINITY_DN10458_c0_g1_i1.p1  ORF type:complete len:282 (+),score=44.15 TRINITY_DN10458_c0_g1_i1:79-846(+)
MKQHKLRFVDFLPLIGVLALSISCIYFAVSRVPPLDDGESIASLGIPRSLDDAKKLSRLLDKYSSQHLYPLLVVFCLVYVFKQTFSIPGSFLLNLMSGALFGVQYGFPLVCILTATGASCCYGLSSIFGSKLAQAYFERRITHLQAVIERERNKNNLFFFCLFLRIFPFTPNFFLNLASPLVGVPFLFHFLSVLFGLMPYNYVSVSAGMQLSQLNSTSEAIDSATTMKLAAISIFVLIPVFFKNKLQKYNPFKES